MLGMIRVRVHNKVTGVIYEHSIPADLHPTGNKLSYKGFKDMCKLIGKLVGWEIAERDYGWYDDDFTIQDIEYGYIIYPKDKKYILQSPKEMFPVNMLADVAQAWKFLINREV